MAPICGMTVIKKFGYRGDSEEEWSNQYFFSGAVPATSADWLALFTALATEEKKLYTSLTSIVRVYGYNDDAPNAVAVYSRDLETPPNTVIPGTFASGVGTLAPGDCAGWVRWKTDRLNTKGKPIFLRKYFHGVKFPTGNPDTVEPSQVTAYNAFGSKLWDGTFLDARKLRSRTHAETILGSSSSPWITTRTLKRRGKRPGS